MESLLQSGELAKRARVSPRTVRYYDELGLLPPSHVTEGGMRLYTPTQLTRLQFIRQMQKVGLSLEDIKAALGEPYQASGRQERVARTLKLLQLQQAHIQAQMAELHRLQKEIETALETIIACFSCYEAECPSSCPQAICLL
ncbi:MAG: MerR family transcriptional regulator [Chloroflexi bacterium]|nr:MerR family transcriptional regulator [Chloroflexota bacterium]